LNQELWTVLRHLMQSVHRRALLSQVDKLLDERVLLGAGVGSKEILQSVPNFAPVVNFIAKSRIILVTLGLQHTLISLTLFTTFETNYPLCNLRVSHMYIPDLYSTRN
jgi:hypothetical protein